MGPTQSLGGWDDGDCIRVRPTTGWKWGDDTWSDKAMHMCEIVSNYWF